jgi:hypothetical protein
LVLSRRFDPIARPSFSRHVAELIGNNAHYGVSRSYGITPVIQVHVVIRYERETP